MDCKGTKSYWKKCGNCHWNNDWVDTRCAIDIGLNYASILRFIHILIVLILFNSTEPDRLCSKNQHNWFRIFLHTFGNFSYLYPYATRRMLMSNMRAFGHPSFWDKEGVSFKHEVPNHDDQWHSSAPDHTLNDTHGLMLLVKIPRNGINIFKIKLEDLQVDVFYEFSAYFANVRKKKGKSRDPKVTLELHTYAADGYRVTEFEIGNIPPSSNMSWSKRGFLFKVTQHQVVLYIVFKIRGKNSVLAIDDIELRACLIKEPSVLQQG